VARDDEAEAVTRAERAGCALCAGIAGKARELAVRDDLAVRNAPQRLEDGSLERRPPVQLELDVSERLPRASEVRPEPVDEPFRNRR
jgi:hypothetical protein